jgi:hypothetical protein
MLVANHQTPGKVDGAKPQGQRDHQELIDKIDMYLRDRRDLCEKDFLFQDCGTEILKGNDLESILRGGIGMTQTQIELSKEEKIHRGSGELCNCDQIEQGETSADFN